MLLCSPTQEIFPLPPRSLVVIIYYCLFLLLVEVVFFLMQSESQDAQLFLANRQAAKSGSSASVSAPWYNCCFLVRLVTAAG